MAATSYNFLHKYLDDSSYTKTSTYSTTSPLEILHKIAEDKRLDGLFDDKGAANLGPLFENHENLVLEHWNAWRIDDPKKQFQDSQEAAVALLVRTVSPGTHAYDFFIVHLLTSSHAVRILLPLIPKKFHVSLVRQWWLLTIAIYICQLRPKFDDDIEVKPNKGWKYVETKAISGPWAQDAHYVKGKDAESLKCASTDRIDSSSCHKRSGFHLGRCSRTLSGCGRSICRRFRRMGWVLFGGARTKQSASELKRGYLFGFSGSLYYMIKFDGTHDGTNPKLYKLIFCVKSAGSLFRTGLMI